MENLPAETLNLVTSYLSKTDLFNIQLVSKQLREKTCGYLYRIIFEEKFGSITPSEIEKPGLLLIERNLHFIKFCDEPLTEGNYLSFDQDGLPVFQRIPTRSSLSEKYQIFKQRITNELIDDLLIIHEKLSETLDKNVKRIDEVRKLEINEHSPLQSLRNQELRAEDLYDESLRYISLFEKSIESCQEVMAAQRRSIPTALKIIFYTVSLFDSTPSYQIPAKTSFRFKKDSIDTHTIGKVQLGDRCQAYYRRGQEGTVFFQIENTVLSVDRKWYGKKMVPIYEWTKIKRDQLPLEYCDLSITGVKIKNRKTTIPLIYQLAVELLERESVNSIEVDLGNLSKNPMKGFIPSDIFSLSICNDPKKSQKLGSKFVPFDCTLSGYGKWKAAKVRFNKKDKYVTWEEMLKIKAPILKGSGPVLPKFYRNNFWKYLET